LAEISPIASETDDLGAAGYPFNVMPIPCVVNRFFTMVVMHLAIRISFDVATVQGSQVVLPPKAREIIYAF